MESFYLNRFVLTNFKRVTLFFLLLRLSSKLILNDSTQVPRNYQNQIYLKCSRVILIYNCRAAIKTKISLQRL